MYNLYQSLPTDSEARKTKCRLKQGWIQDLGKGGGGGGSGGFVYLWLHAYTKIVSYLSYIIKPYIYEHYLSLDMKVWKHQGCCVKGPTPYL